MQSLEFPQAPFQPHELADWLELSALEADDKDASAGDLERELKRLNYSGTEGMLGNVFTEVDRRVKATGGVAYPFERQNTSIKLKSDAKMFPAYVFCLALSFFKWKTRKAAPENPWLLFEELAGFSAKKYIGGDVLVFGTSSREGKSSKKRFEQNVNRLAKSLGEGEGFKKQKTFSTKDSKLDIVAWKGFPDGRPSQVILFGQCAAGQNWRSKLTELDPEAFWDDWMSDGKVSAPLRSVFMPHRLFDDVEWRKRAVYARLLFDRCRVVAFAHEDASSGGLAKRLLTCCRTEWKLKL